MDARDRLRRYLEQRRELGESEFVLDGLPVDDVLKLVGARGGARPKPSAGAQPPRTVDGPPPGYMEGPPLDDGPDYGGPPMPDSPLPASQAPTPAAPVPERRFSANASTDWRETLRNAGAGRPGGPAQPPSPAPAAAGPSQAGTSQAGTSTPGVSPPPAAERLREPQRPAAAASSGANGPVVLPAWLEALGVPAGLEAGRLRVSDMAPHVAALPSLEHVANLVAGCTACALHKTARNPVPGEGNPHADFLCVGEAPGANEDEQGRPFVGEAGQLLTKILGAIQLTRDEVYICNVLKHRPPGNRDPLPDEVLACQPYLLRQIELVQPKVILALGRFAAQTLLQTTTAIGALRGKLHRYHGVPLIVTYHPAALLRNEAWKRPTWEDVKLARRVLDAARASGTAANSGTE